jgi:NAD(P)-dependent dehydrogenase (short-subunit alcohol dehydrogenase family)
LESVFPFRTRAAGDGGPWRSECGGLGACADSRFRTAPVAGERGIARGDRHAVVGFSARRSEGRGICGFRGKNTGRPGRQKDVARAIAFLIADSFMTGHVLVCDGGLRLGA